MPSRAMLQWQGRTRPHRFAAGDRRGPRSGYLTDRAAGIDALLVCDTWELADALNRRLHSELAAAGPTPAVARDQKVAPGDIVLSRRNDPTINVHPGSADSARADQVRNGNRWRVAALDVETNRIAAERLSDGARVVFHGDYLQEHVTLGYATTVHSAQGVTADSCYAILGEGASRAMAYVAMTRGRHNNEAFLYQRLSNEADHEHSRIAHGEAIHSVRHGNKYSAAQHFRTILANDDRPRTVHVEAERATRHLLPDLVTELLQRNSDRCRSRQAAWRAQLRTNELWSAGYERMTAAEGRSSAGIYADGLEL
jgi:hypothetical protein